MRKLGATIFVYIHIHKAIIAEVWESIGIIWGWPSVTDSKGKTRDNPTDFLKFTFMKGHKGQVVSDIIRA